MLLFKKQWDGVIVLERRPRYNKGHSNGNLNPCDNDHLVYERIQVYKVHQAESSQSFFIHSSMANVLSLTLLRGNGVLTLLTCVTVSPHVPSKLR